MFYNPFRAESFEWDEEKNQSNIEKHGICFEDAQRAFLDPEGLVFIDERHSIDERRYLYVGKVEENIITVRFTLRGATVRIIGAGKWRKGKKQHETKRRLY